MSYWIDICCNDPDNGIFNHKAEAIHIHDHLELRASNWDGYAFHEQLNGFIRLAGKKWPTDGSKDWVGNWCWNRYYMPPHTICDFLIWLHKCDLFDVEQGDDILFTLWKWREPIARPILLHALFSEAA